MMSDGSRLGVRQNTAQALADIALLLFPGICGVQTHLLQVPFLLPSGTCA